MLSVGSTGQPSFQPWLRDTHAVDVAVIVQPILLDADGEVDVPLLIALVNQLLRLLDAPPRAP